MNKWLVSNNEGFTPVLKQSALKRLSLYGTTERFSMGDILIVQGLPYERFIAVLHGTVVVEQVSESGTWPIKRCNEGEFIGEINTLSGHESRISARADTDGTVLSLTRAELRSLMDNEQEIGEIIMGAYILRHLYLVARGTGNVAVLGSPASEDTNRLRELLSLYDHPYVFLDLESEPDIDRTLSGFGITTEDLPVLVYRQLQVLRKPSNEQVTKLLGLDTL